MAAAGSAHPTNPLISSTASGWPALPGGSPTDRSEAEVDGWAIHPGGRAILDAAADALDLRPDQLSASREVLRSFGNMSSPTVLFVLERLARTAANGVALTFGPGLSLEGMVWTQGTRRG